MLAFDIKIRDSNYDEITHINKKRLNETIEAINYALLKEGLSIRIAVIEVEKGKEEAYL